MTPSIIESQDENKVCAGNGCKNVGTTLLKIRYINKEGYFCDSCTQDLWRLELAVKEGNGDCTA